MKKFHTKQKALLLRQSGELHRANAEYQDAMARELDGELSKTEKEEIKIRLKWLTGLIEKASMEYRLAMIGKKHCTGACKNVSC